MTASNIALKEAKLAKKPFMFYDESMHIEQKIRTKFDVVRQVLKTIAEDRIVPYYQPILDNKTGEIEKYECLVQAHRTAKPLALIFF